MDISIHTEKPLLGICRGAQLINVAFGGTLIQDLPSEAPSNILHRQTEPKNAHSHYVNVTVGSPLHTLIGCERIRVNSFHHQAVKRLGDGLQITARADDGVIEAFCLCEKRFVRAYQWHPERLYHVDENSKLIFREFISACETE